MITNSLDYIPLALRTEATLSAPFMARLEHSIIGLVTETGEIADAYKKAKFYGKEIDIVNLCEEMGDLFWYLAVMIDAINKYQRGRYHPSDNVRDAGFESLMRMNIEKLRKRYPEKFSPELALNRDLDAERKALGGA